MNKSLLLFLIFLLIISLISATHPVAASQTPEPVRSKSDSLRVGLVLSGGGAKGVAHIGILKAIEESGLRIDYITGTSMGSLVGGLYAKVCMRLGITVISLLNLPKRTILLSYFLKTRTADIFPTMRRDSMTEPSFPFRSARKALTFLQVL